MIVAADIRAIRSMLRRHGRAKHRTRSRSRLALSEPGDSGYLEKPAEDSAPVRVAEARKDWEILKARPEFAGQFNSRAIVEAAQYAVFQKIIQAERPDVVFTQWPIDGHRDHRAISTLAYDTWLAMGKRFALYFYEVSNGGDTLMFSPTHHVDISGVEPGKRAACCADA